MKQLLGVAIGLAIALGVMCAFDWLDTNILLPDEYIPNAGAASHAMMIAGPAFGALAGGVIALRVANWPVSGWLVALATAGFTLTIGIVNPYPLWLQIATVAAPLLAGIVVSGIARPA